MTRTLVLATVLLAAVTATASAQTCNELRQLRMDKLWEQANAAFDAGKAAADETYEEELQSANTIYADALARAEAAYDGSLYWAVNGTEERGHSAIAAPITSAVTRRAEVRNTAHREWASSVSDITSRWIASMEQAEINRSASVGKEIQLIEQQTADCP